MQTTHSSSNIQTITGWVLSGLPSLLLLADAIGKLIKPQPVVESTLALGYPESVLTSLGVVLLLATLLYAVPRTSFIGALLLTAYLGGAVATHVCLQHPLFTHVLFPVYLSLAIWGGLYLRNETLRRLVRPNAHPKTTIKRHVLPSLSNQY